MIALAPLAASAAPVPFEATRTTLEASLTLGWSSSDRRLSDDGSVPFNEAAAALTHSMAPRIYFRGDVVAASAQMHGGAGAVQIREGYLNYGDGPDEIRVGIQTIAWARTDVINPEDVLTPYRYDWLTFADTDQRVGAFAIRYSRRMESAQISIVGLPLLRTSTVPLGDTEGLAVRERRPQEPLGAAAMRLDGSAGSLDWGLQLVRHRSLRPNLVPSNDGKLPRLDLTHPAETVWGADFSWQTAGVVLRGEAAYTDTSNCCNALGYRFTKRDNVAVVVGADFQPLLRWRMVAQVIQRSAFETSDESKDLPLELREVARANDVLNDELYSSATAASLGLYYAELGSRLGFTLDSAWIVQTKDYVIRPRVSWALTDSLKVKIAADLYSGDSEGILGRLGDNSLVLVGLTYRFRWKD